METLQKRQLILSCAIAVLVLLFASCTKKIESKSGVLTEDKLISKNFLSRGSQTLYKEGDLILGTKKQNPYTVANMTSAWASLATTSTTLNTGTVVRTTHYYVKFKPQNYNQYEALKQDTTIFLSDFPIENDIAQNGNRYHDPSLPDSVPTYQYTAVKIDYQFADSIPYEIIDNLYIPEQDASLQYQTGGVNDLFVDKLLNKAYTQTANYEDTIALDNQSAYVATSSYNPSGRIRIFDTRVSRLIGMEGVRVQARRWFTVYLAVPDYNGNYAMPFRYNRPCNYSLWFATPTFAISEHLFGLTCWINGPKIRGDWFYDINDGYDRFVGHIFRGAFRYNFKDIGGLQRPYLYGMRQRYVARNELSAGSGINWIIFPVIRIARLNANGEEYQSDEIFSTACHETAHSSHFKRMLTLDKFILVSARLRESWAVALEWYITNIEYVGRGIPNYGKENYFPTANPPGFPNSYAYQYWNSGVSKDYTPLYIDINDETNQLGQNYAQRGSGSIDDRVRGYSLPKIELFWLRFIAQNFQLKALLKTSKPSGVTDSDIDLFINQY